MYGLPQVGTLTNDELIKHLVPFGYYPTSHTPGLWTHNTRNISFVLTVDDFGIKYTKMRDATHLLNALRTKYELSTYWTGFSYCGLTLKWDYTEGTAQLSIPGYIATVLHKYNHPPPNTPEYSPHVFPRTTYSATHIKLISESITPAVSELKRK